MLHEVWQFGYSHITPIPDPDDCVDLNVMKPTLADVLNEELQRLESRRLELNNLIHNSRYEMHTIDTSITLLRTIFSKANLTVEEPREQLFDVVSVNGDLVNYIEAKANGKPRVRGKTTGAILKYLLSHPDARKDQIADALETKIASTSRSPRRVVINTLDNLVRKGLIKVDPNGRHRANE